MSIKQYNDAGTFSTILSAQPTANRTITIPDISGTLSLVDSQALTGTPTAPTAVAGTNTTQLATTAYVLANSVQATEYATNTLGGTVKMRISGSTLYLRNDGTDA
jgi:hypothetical protein